MSETDDRMERAERIRRMRQSREPDEDDQGPNAEGGGADDGAAADTADEAAERSPDVDDAESQETNDEEDHETEAAGAQDSDDAGNAEAVGTAAPTPTGGAAGEAEDVTPSETDDGRSETDDPASGASTSAIEGPPDVTAQAARSDAAVTAVDAHSSETTPPAGTAVEAASASPAAGSAGPGAIAPLGESAGFSLPGQEEMSDAPADDAADGVATGAARARGNATTATEPSVRVLEFTVGDQAYCIDIECVEEIVKRDAVTRVPNTEDYVEGVVDLRGQITTILDTKQLLDVEESGPENLLVIFAPDAFEEHGTVGWVVDEVRQVVPVMDSQVRTAPSDDDHVRGVVDREDEDLVVWIRPGDAMDQAVAVEDDE